VVAVSGCRSSGSSCWNKGASCADSCEQPCQPSCEPSYGSGLMVPGTTYGTTLEPSPMEGLPATTVPSTN
jgi:hypothetical protein